MAINEAIETILTSPDPEVRRKTLEDFISAGEPVEIRVLSRLAYQSADSEVRDRCLSRIVERGREADARFLLMDWRPEMDADERARAAECLEKLL